MDQLPLEQIHGWVGGGTKGDFPHYAYHGYYTQDWSKLDANMGTERISADWWMKRISAEYVFCSTW